MVRFINWKKKSRNTRFFSNGSFSSLEITNTRHKIHRHLLFQKDSVIIIFLQGYFHFSERGRERNSRPKEYSLYFGREFFFFHWAIFHHQQLCVNRILESSKQEWWWWWWLVKKSEEKINNKNRWIPLGIVVVVWWYTLTWILDSWYSISTYISPIPK